MTPDERTAKTSQKDASQKKFPSLVGNFGVDVLHVLYHTYRWQITDPHDPALGVVSHEPPWGMAWTKTEAIRAASAALAAYAEKKWAGEEWAGEEEKE